MLSTCRAPAASGAISRSRTSRSSASRKNGFPPVALRQAATNSGATPSPSARLQTVAEAPVLSGRGRSTRASGAVASRESSAIGRSPVRAQATTATGSPSSRGAR